MNTILMHFVAVFTLVLNVFGINQKPHSLSQVSYSLENRYANSFVNEVFADNILLTIAYLNGKVKKGIPVSWKMVEKEGESKFTLKPGETFAFHDAVLDKYKGKVAATTNAHFNSFEGFKSDGWLIGDGVCHLASFMYVAAKNAGLLIEAPTPHDFAAIPNVEKRDGVSIYSESTVQNLYITNNKNKDVTFVFVHKNGALTIRVEMEKTLSLQDRKFPLL